MSKIETPSARLARELQNTAILQILLDLCIQIRVTQLSPDLDPITREASLDAMRRAILQDVAAAQATALASLSDEP